MTTSAGTAPEPQTVDGTPPAPCENKDTKGVGRAKAAEGLAFEGAETFGGGPPVADAGLPDFHGGGGGLRFGGGGTFLVVDGGTVVGAFALVALAFTRVRGDTPNLPHDLTACAVRMHNCPYGKSGRDLTPRIPSLHQTVASQQPVACSLRLPSQSTARTQALA